MIQTLDQTEPFSGGAILLEGGHQVTVPANLISAVSDNRERLQIDGVCPARTTDATFSDPEVSCNFSINRTTGEISLRCSPIPLSSLTTVVATCL
jgi:hypothetical protein